jgi:Flp pilus assembly pilin Flp
MLSNDKSTSPSLLARTREALASLRRDQRGASFVEYVIVVGLVAIVCIFAFGEFGKAVDTKVKKQTQAITNMQ